MTDGAVNRLRFFTLLCAATLLSLPCGAEEYFIIEDSSVIGRNFGYVSGTPANGLTRPGDLDFVVEVAPFMKNLELFDLKGTDSTLGQDVPGRTLIGFLLPTRFRYRPHEKVIFEVGAVLGHDFGDDRSLSIAEPLVRLAYQPLDEVFLIAGTIFPTHWMSDALLDDNHRLEANTEQGFQFRVNRLHWKNDTWINWRVREDEINPEEFELGHASRLELFDQTLWLDVEALWSHVGGQISESSRVEHNLATFLGGSIGVGDALAWAFIDELRVGGHFLWSHDKVRDQPNQTGTGWRVKGVIESRPLAPLLLRLNGQYFRGDDFLARRGDPLYSFEDYGQIGLNSVWTLPAGLRIEAGLSGLFNDGQFNHVYQVAFTWGYAFGFDFINPRPPLAEPK